MSVLNLLKAVFSLAIFVLCFIVFFLCIFWLTAAYPTEPYAQPDPTATPGDTCNFESPDFWHYAYKEHIAICHRRVTFAEKQAVALFYGIPEDRWYDYEFDHLIPLCAGGSNDIKNIWVQPIDEAEQKDVIEVQECKKMDGGQSQDTTILNIKNWLSEKGK